GVEDGEGADRARGQARRLRSDLLADDPRGGDRDAGVHADRGAAHGGVRRVLGGGAARPDRRRRGQAGDHGGRQLAARADRAAQGQTRKGGRGGGGGGGGRGPGVAGA